MSDAALMRLWSAYWPGIVLAAVLLCALAVFVWGPTGGRARIDRREGSALLPKLLIDFGYWLAIPAVDGLARVGVRPNHVTLGALVVAGVSAVLFGAGLFMAGVWVLGGAALLDMFDGLLARRLDLKSEAGAFLDSFGDRVTEGVAFGGLAYYGAGGPLTWVCFWALLASLMVSYARARGQSLGADPAVGLMQRPERLLLLFVSLFAAPLVAVFVEPRAASPAYHVATVGIGLLAALSTMTAVTRARWVMRRLGGPSDETHAESGASESTESTRTVEGMP